MELVLLELLKIINSKDSTLATIGWAKARFEEIQLSMKKD